MSVLGARWKELSAEDKAPYEEQAEELRDAAHTRADAEDEEADAKAAAKPAAQKRKRLSKGEDMSDGCRAPRIVHVLRTSHSPDLLLRPILSHHPDLLLCAIAPALHGSAITWNASSQGQRRHLTPARRLCRSKGERRRHRSCVRAPHCAQTSRDV